MENKDFVGADSISAREEAEREHIECSPTDSTPPACDAVGGDVPDAPMTGDVPDAPSADAPAEEAPPQRTPWYVDLKKDEFVAFRMLTARLVGPLRLRTATLVVSLFSFVTMVGYALYEWLMHWVNTPDPVLLAGGVLVLIPALILYWYVPYHLRRDAEKQYDRSLQAGMDFVGELVVYPDAIEKVTAAVTARVRIDERMLFIETPDMLVVTTMNSPAIVMPARCLTEEMVATVRQAVESIPDHCRRFVGRIQPKGETVAPSVPKAKPEELWVNTFTYTPEEYTVVLKGLIQQHFWKKAPLLALLAMVSAFALGYDFETMSFIPCIWIFVVIMAVLILFNLVLPLRRVSRGVEEQLTAHDMTMQVRLDTMGMRMKLPKGSEMMVLWCDVDHVYEREDFVEIVHNKNTSLYIPKRCIEDLDALDAILKQCRGEQ